MPSNSRSPLALGGLQLISLKELEFLRGSADKRKRSAARFQRERILSISGITSSLLSQIANSPTAANQFVTDLNQLAQDVQSGNLSAAQQDFVTLSQDALSGATSSTATSSASGITTNLLSDIASSSASSTSFVGELNQLGTDLQNGDLASSQEDMLSLDSTALNAASSASPSSSAAPTTSATASTANPAESAYLIQAIMQAMESGNNSAVGTAMTALASVSTSSAGASALQSASSNYGSSTSSTSASSTTQLLQSLNSSSSSSLSLLA